MGKESRSFDCLPTYYCDLIPTPLLKVEDVDGEPDLILERPSLLAVEAGLLHQALQRTPELEELKDVIAADMTSISWH